MKTIDLFAGPGGLGEGFSRAGFASGIAIEKDPSAHETLRFRFFWRAVRNAGEAHQMNGSVGDKAFRERLFQDFPDFAESAFKKAWCATLGETSQRHINQRIHDTIGDDEQWVLIGGPPCQAYSLVGRSRMRPVNENFENDHRHFLYREYLKIVAAFAPPIFVMENVKGLFSAKVNGESVFDRIYSDLLNPRQAVKCKDRRLVGKKISYDIFPISEHGAGLLESDPRRYLIKSEDFGIPQKRHRIILIGVRNDINASFTGLERRKPDSVQGMISDLPPVFSDPTKTKLSREDVLNMFLQTTAFEEIRRKQKNVASKILESIASHEKNERMLFHIPTDGMMSESLANWLRIGEVGSILNHEPRRHMPTDLHRYLFASSFAAVNKISPKLTDFPPSLLPKHKNVAADGRAIFSDRFRVQVSGEPSTTVTSHISKDGHYYIHPDPVQCRSLTVREAARLQTFPDDYVFLGNRTSQYHQVGNAVPPYLAYQIACNIRDSVF